MKNNEKPEEKKLRKPRKSKGKLSEPKTKQEKPRKTETKLQKEK